MSSSAFHTPQQGAVEQFLLRSQESTLVCLAQLKSDCPSSQGFITWAVPEILTGKVSDGRLRKRKERRKRKARAMLFCPSCHCRRAETCSSWHPVGQETPSSHIRDHCLIDKSVVWLGPNCRCSIRKSESAQVSPREKGGSGFTNKCCSSAESCPWL